MSFSSLLSQIKHKQSSSSPSPKGRSIKPSSFQQKPQPTHQQALPRKLDPAVQRLKELRRIENEKRETEVAAKKTAKAAAASSKRTVSRRATSSTSTRRDRNPTQTQSTTSSIAPSRTEPVKRLTFAELMKQGQQKTKELQMKEASPTTTVDSKFQSRTQPIKKFQSKTRPQSQFTSTNRKGKIKVQGISLNKSDRIDKPKPVAQPSAKLKAKLAAKAQSKGATSRMSVSNPTKKGTRYEDITSSYSDYSEDDFIVDDDKDVTHDLGYNREEIRRMFRRGNTQAYDDENLSDMEADGGEIWEEEEMAEREARREEKLEQERERRRIEEKKKRLGRM